MPLVFHPRLEGELSVMLCTQEFFNQWGDAAWEQIFGPEGAHLSSGSEQWTEDYRSILAESATRTSPNTPEWVSCVSVSAQGRPAIDAYRIEHSAGRP